MKNLKKFNELVLEGRGISDIIKEYSKFIYSYFEENNFKVQLDLDYEQLPLIDLRIIFQYSNEYRANYDPTYSTLINNNLHDISMNIFVDKNDIVKHKIIGLITHELTHILEYYNVSKISKKKKITITPTHIDIKISYEKLNIKKDDYFYINFIYLLYLSLDTEMNARISQVYEYLYDFRIKDEDILLNKLKEHKNWEYLELLSNFKSDIFVDENIKNIELSGLIKITNDLINNFSNKEINKRTKLLNFIPNKVNNLDDIKLFYKNFSIYFKKKSELHLEKFKYLIKEVIEDLNGNRPYNELYRYNK